MICGVIGARIYHLFTGYKWSEGGIVGAFEIWKGGLSIWGAVLGGAIAVVVLGRRHHLDVLRLLDAIAPGVVLAQAIGRWGNYFNQELFGRPTTWPWGARDRRSRIVRSGMSTTRRSSRPSCTSRCGACSFSARCSGPKRSSDSSAGQTFALYVAMYTFGRVWFEWMRVDAASKIFGIRFNLLLSAALCVASTIWFVRLGRREQPTPELEATADADT